MEAVTLHRERLEERLRYKRRRRDRGVSQGLTFILKLGAANVQRDAVVSHPAAVVWRRIQSAPPGLFISRPIPAANCRTRFTYWRSSEADRD
jgi:hypothetical protein